MNDLIVISGPSGAGKSTLIRRLLEHYPDLRFSVSHTTRHPRQGEKNGREYFFVSGEEFQWMAEEGKFCEWARVHDHYYGTSWKEIGEKSTGGQILVLDVDVQGARNLKKAFPGALMIFIVPPSFALLKERLQGREKHWDEELEKRLRTAIAELHEYDIYDYLIVNEQLEEAFYVLCAVVTAFRWKMKRNQPIIDRLLEEKP